MNKNKAFCRLNIYKETQIIQKETLGLQLRKLIKYLPWFGIPIFTVPIIYRFRFRFTLLQSQSRTEVYRITDVQFLDRFAGVIARFPVRVSVYQIRASLVDFVECWPVFWVQLGEDVKLRFNHLVYEIMATISKLVWSRW